MATKQRCDDCIAPEGKACPFWISAEDGVIENNISTGESRMVTGCAPKVMIRLMEFVIRTNQSAAAEISQNREVTGQGLEAIARATLVANNIDPDPIVERIRQRIDERQRLLPGQQP